MLIVQSIEPPSERHRFLDGSRYPRHPTLRSFAAILKRFAQNTSKMNEDYSSTLEAMEEVVYNHHIGTNPSLLYDMISETPHKYYVKPHTYKSPRLFVRGIGRYLGNLGMSNAILRSTSTVIAYYIDRRLGDIAILTFTRYHDSLRAVLRLSTKKKLVLGDGKNANEVCCHFSSSDTYGRMPCYMDCPCDFDSLMSI